MFMSAVIGFSSKGFKNEFKIAVVNEPSVFEPSTFYCKRTELSPRHKAVNCIKAPLFLKLG